MAARNGKSIPREVEQELGAYDDAFLECRDLGHGWATVGYFEDARQRVRRRLECWRCGTTRTDAWSRDGLARFGPSYRHAEGYRIGVGVTRAAVRHEVVGRVTIYADEGAMLEALEGSSRRRRRS